MVQFESLTIANPPATSVGRKSTLPRPLPTSNQSPRATGKSPSTFEQIVNRSALLKEAETDVAALLEKVSDMDDLIVQFDGCELGKRFIEAWKRPASSWRPAADTAALRQHRQRHSKKDNPFMSKKPQSRIGERSARTGKFVKKGTAARSPNTTVREHIPLPGKGSAKPK